MCEKAGKNPIHKKIVDQIVAVDSFVAFKKLMCKRNAELNTQAMKMLVEKQVKTEMDGASQKNKESSDEHNKSNPIKLLEEQ